MREPSEDAEPRTVSVLAQQGTPDTRSLQPLAPLVTLPELHAKLWVSSNGGKEQATTLSNSLPGHAGKAKVGLLRQSSARSKQSARSARPEAVGVAAGTARPATNMSSKLQVPDYVNPMLWAAALQQEAMQGQRQGQAGLLDARLNTVLCLQDSMLAQVEQYKQLAPLLQDYQQPQHPLLRAVRKLPPGTVPGEDPTQAAAVAAATPCSQQPTKSSPAATPAPTAGASAGPPAVTAAAVTLLPLQQMPSLAGRLEAACQQVIQDVPGITPADTPTSGGPVSTATTTRRHNQHSRVQLHTHRSTTHKNPKAARVHINSHSGASPRQQQQQQQQQQVSSPSAAGSVHPPMLLLDRDSQSGQACSSTTPGTCHTIRSSIWNASAAALKTSRDHSQVQSLDSPGMQQMQQQSPPEGSFTQQQEQQRQRQRSPPRGDLKQQLRPCDYEAVPFKLQHLRQEVLQEPAGLRCRGATAAGSPSSKQAPCQPPPSTLQVLQAQLAPEALEALKASIAASVQKQLQHYHTHMLDTQQQLLQRVLASQPAQQQNEQQQTHGPGSHTSTCGITRPAAGSPDSAAAAAAVGPSAAELTMQQLVVRLAQRDVQQDEQQQSPDTSSSDPVGLTAAVNRRVAAAGSLSELLDAANEHLKLAAQGSGFRLDISRIARLHKMGKQWLSDASSARSTGSGTRRTKGRDGGTTGRSTARSHHKDAATESSNVLSSSSSPMQSAREPQRTASPVPRPVPPGAAVHPPVHPGAASVACELATAAGGAQRRTSYLGSEQAGGPAAAAGGGAQRRASCLGSEQAGIPAAAGGGAQRRGSCLGSQRASMTGVAPAVAACASTTSMASVILGSAQPQSTTDHDNSSSSRSAVPAGSTADPRVSTDYDNSSSSSSSSRLPAAMKASPPQLQPPSASEVSALPMPSLPQLLDLSHEPVKVLQARLERVWDVLGVPAEQQLNMVLRYTSRAAATQFEYMLEAWECAAAAVLQREAILAQVLQLQALLGQHAAQQQQQQQQQGLWHNSHRVSTCSAGAASICCGAEAGAAAGPPVEFELGVTVQHARQVLWAFLAAEHQVQLAAQQLFDAVGEQLQVDCCAYPPEGSGFSLTQLQELLTAAWVAAGNGHGS